MLVAPLLQDNPFVSTWDTTKAGSANTTIVIPTVSTGTYGCQVNWGDGTTSTMSTYNDAAWTHVYGSTGVYTVKIYGTFRGIQFNNAGDCLKLMSITKWGSNFRLGNSGNYFYGCANLVVTATDVLIMNPTTSFVSAFRNCTALTTIPSINSWDFSQITNMAVCFFGCTLFNQAISLNTVKSTSFSNSFQGCAAFNSSITLNTTAATNLSAMLLGCSVFNQPVTGIGPTTIVSNWSGMFSTCAAFNQSVSSFNTSAATDMSNMFSGATAFNQAVSTFTTSSVTTMVSMFQYASAFNQSVASFNIAALTSAASMLSSSAFNITNYNLLLDSVTGWPSQGTIQNNVVFSAGSAHYSGANAIAGRLVLTGTHSWNVSDGGTP